jgi:multicomponent Na+:H+ antiporter subunit B
MLKNSLIFLLLIAFAAVLLSLFYNYQESEQLGLVATHYANQTQTEVGASNIVSAIVVTYRGLDTLGEVVILFLTAAIIGFMLKAKHNSNESSNKPKHKGSEILQTAANALVPIIIVFGAYIFVNGHLTPGGGFQGGAVIASAFVLLFMARTKSAVSHRIISFTESISGFVFVFVGVLGLVLAGGFLDNTILPLGTFGTIISAGAIPVIYIFIGLKVGAELTSIVSNLKESQNIQL